MFIIQSFDGTRGWVSGIFLSEIEAKAHMNVIPVSEQSHNLRSIELNYPFYIIENHTRPESDRFAYTNKEGLIRRIITMEPSDNLDDIPPDYCTVYAIYKDYRPPNPGEDYMGSLDHHHIDNDFLIKCRKNINTINESF
jgi:hypothetical protein